MALKTTKPRNPRSLPDELEPQSNYLECVRGGKSTLSAESTRGLASPVGRSIKTVTKRACAFNLGSSKPCMAPPLKDSDYCRMHCPEHAEEVQEARRLGGLRRKQEVALSGTWDFKGLESASDIRRLIEVAALDTLSLENSLSRNRTLVYIAQVALRALETNEYEQRLIALEQAMRLQQKDLPDESIFLADEPVLLEIPYAEETDATS